MARGLYDVHGGADALAAKLDELCAEVSDGDRRAAPGRSCLSDRHSNAELAPIPSLLLTAAMHHHLVREKTRTQVGLVVEAGDVREVHHVALLIGYGAAAVNPYLAIESVEDLARSGVYVDVEPEKARHQRGQVARQGRAQGDEQDGRLHGRLLHRRADLRGAGPVPRARRPLLHRHHQQARRHQPRPRSPRRSARRHLRAYPADGIPLAHRLLPVGGEYQWRREGEPHLFDPETVFRLQHSTRSGRYDIFKQYTRHIDDQAERLMTLRGLLKFAADREPIPIEEVEPVSEIVKRFSTGAMSYGSISLEAHQTLAHRDEPASAASPTPARAARTPTGCTTRSGAARSSRSRRAGSG